MFQETVISLYNQTSKKCPCLVFLSPTAIWLMVSSISHLLTILMRIFGALCHLASLYHWHWGPLSYFWNVSPGTQSLPLLLYIPLRNLDCQWVQLITGYLHLNTHFTHLHTQDLLLLECPHLRKDTCPSTCCWESSKIPFLSALTSNQALALTSSASPHP